MISHALSEPTKRLIDWSALPAALSVSGLSGVLTVILTLLAIAWYVVRFHDRLKYGPPRDRGGGE